MGPTEPEAAEPEATSEQKLGKAEAIKNAIIQAAGNWAFSHETEVEILDGKGKVDIVLELRGRRLACEIRGTTKVPDEVDHLLNCLSAGYTEIFCVCDPTVRRQRIEALLLSRIMPGQEVFFQFLTVHQFLTRLADIGQATQKSGGPATGDKALPTPVAITKDDQAVVEKQMLAKIRENRAKAKAATTGKPPKG